MAQNAIAPVLLHHRFDPRLATTPRAMATRVFQDQLNGVGENDYSIVTLRSALGAEVLKHRPAAMRDRAALRHRVSPFAGARKQGSQLRLARDRTR